MMKVERYTLGIYQANCYLIWKDDHVLIVDPGGTSKKIVSIIEERNGIVDGVLLTHGHYDHIAGIDFFMKHFSCDVYIDAADAKMFQDETLSCASSMGGGTVQHSAKDLTPHMVLGAFKFDVISAPGHTNGCSLFLFDDFIMSGDVLFKNSIGRCDLPTGSTTKMTKSLRNILVLDQSYIVYPGHGDQTNVREELLHNPFLQNI